MKPAQYDIVINQGATFTLSFIWTDDNDVVIPLTGWTASSQVRSSHDARSILLTLIPTIDGPNGKVILTASPVFTSRLDEPRAVWDVKLTDPAGKVHRVMEGKVIVNPAVTR